MHIFLSLLLAVQIICALALIVLVLIQHGKGADMGAAFGSGSSGSLFGASGSANFLSHTTAVLAAIFFASTLALAYFGSRAMNEGAGSVLATTTTKIPTIPTSAPAPVPAAPSASSAIPPATTTPATPEVPEAPSSK